MAMMLASSVLAETEINSHTAASNTLFNGTTEDVIMNFTGGSDDYFNKNLGNPTSSDNITVTSWIVGDGYANASDDYTYTFTGTISGAGNIQTRNSGNTKVTYVFEGDMSTYSGNISSRLGGLDLVFGGAARSSVSGTGAIDTFTASQDAAKRNDLTYSVGVGTSSITNSSIVTDLLTMTGDGVSSTIYNVESNITANGFNSNGATINIGEGKNLTVKNTGVNASTSAFSFATGSSLSAVSGSEMQSLTLSGDVAFTLTATADATALSLGSINMESLTSLTLNVTFTGEYVKGTEFVILSATNGFTDINKVTANIAGAPTGELSFADGRYIYTITEGANDLFWAGGDGTWATGQKGWTDDIAFLADDHVTFANDTVDDTDIITIAGSVTPGKITVSGAGNTSFISDDADLGIIAGDTQIVKTGTGSLTIATANTFSGGVMVNEGTLVIDNNAALGTGTATVAADAALELKGLSHLAGLNYSLADGATLILSADGDDRSTTTGLGSIAASITIKVNDNQGTLSVGDSSSLFERHSAGYTISVGAGSTLVDYSRLRLSSATGTASTVTITGGGTYIVDSVIMRSDNDSGTYRLNIDANTTLKVTNADNSINASEAGFSLSEHGGSSEVNIWGALDLASGISSRDGGGVINVKSGGELIMRQGLTTAASRTGGTEVLNVESGGILSLYDQGNTTTATSGYSFNIDSGAIINAKSTGTTDVYTQLTFDDAAGAVFHFGADAGNVLAMHQNMDINKANVTGGTLQLAGATNTIAEASIASGASITSDSMTVGGVALAGKDGSEATITAKGANASVQDGVFSNVTVSDAIFDGQTLTSNGSNFSDVTFIGGSLTATAATILSGSSLEGTSLDGDITLGSDVSLNDVTLGTGVKVAEGVSISGSDIKVAGTTVTGPTTLDTFLTSENTTLTSVAVFGVEGLNANVMKSLTGEYTLELSMDASQLTIFEEKFITNKEVVLFELKGVDLVGTEYNNVTLDINGGLHSYKVLGSATSDSDGNVIFYIPEPSTATLSLLALAGLLVRRRRQSA